MDIETYSKVGPQYYDIQIPYLLEKYLKSESWHTYLDCGCGDGSLLYALQKRGFFKNKKVCALDLSASRIALVKQIDTHINAYVDSAEDIQNIPEHSVDFFVSTQVIEHVDDKKMADSIDRVTRPGATIFISTVFKKKYGWYFYRNNGKWVLDPTHVREYMHDEELINLFDATQFTLLANEKSLLKFPFIDFFVKRLKVKNRHLFDNQFMRFIRKFKLPIPGYYHWEIVLKKN